MAIELKNCSSNDFNSDSWQIGYSKPAVFVKLKLSNPGDININIRKIYVTPDVSTVGESINPLNDLAFYLPIAAHNYSSLTNVVAKDYSHIINSLAVIHGDGVLRGDGYQLLNSFDLRPYNTTSDVFDLSILFAPFQETNKNYRSVLVIEYKPAGSGYYKSFKTPLTGESFAFSMDKSEMDTKEITGEVFEVNGIDVYEVFTIE